VMECATFEGIGLQTFLPSKGKLFCTFCAILHQKIILDDDFPSIQLFFVSIYKCRILSFPLLISRKGFLIAHFQLGWGTEQKTPRD
jgi:hypothetical protein